MSEEKSYEVIEELGQVTNREGKWNICLKKVSWHGNAEKYDLRPWSPDGEKMGKGLTLTDEEFEALKKFFKEMED